MRGDSVLAVARPAARRLLPALLALALPVAAASCGGGEPGGEGPEEVGAASGTPAASPGAGQPAPDPAASPPSGPGADSARDGRPSRAFRFRIRNRGGEPAVVVADAGAGTVLLDTVGPADSAWVRVETRADRLEIRARSGARGEVARARYDLERPAGDTLLEFEVPPAASSDTAGG